MNKKKTTLYIILALLILVPNVVYAACPLGPEVTKDLKGILGIFQILGPIITVVFTIWDLIVGLTKGEIEKEFRTIWQKVYKRVIAAFFLFFIPLLLNQAFILFGLYDNESCDLSGNGSGNETKQSCAAQGKQYDASTNSCKGEASKSQVCDAFSGKKGDNETAGKCEGNSGCKYNWNTGKCTAEYEDKCYAIKGPAASNEQAAKCEAVSGCTYIWNTGECKKK